MPTIAAIATPAGQGGIGIVRISGPDAREFLAKSFVPRSKDFHDFTPWKLHHGRLRDAAGEELDDVLAVFMPGPHTFTGEDVAEIHCHGGQTIVETVLENALALGARRAEAGEFTRRAYLNGRMDLSQAEAVAELIASPSREAMRYSFNRLNGLLGDHVYKLREEMDELRALACIGLDFPDDEIDSLEKEEFSRRVEGICAGIRNLLKGSERARIMGEGATIVLAGPVNAGKSSLLNALSGRARALVSDIPGTTRDFIEQTLNLDGLPVRIIDTAGLRPAGQTAADPVEALGIDQTNSLLETADLVLIVLDSTVARPAGFLERITALSPTAKHLLVFNKTDLSGETDFSAEFFHNVPVCGISALTGANVDGLCRMMRNLILAGAAAEPPENGVAANGRQTAALKLAFSELEGLKTDLGNNISYDCCISRLDTAASELDKVVGLSAHDDLLNKIFSQFCIGK